MRGEAETRIETLPELLAAAGEGAAPAIHYAGRVLGYGELEERSRRLAGSLGSLGIGSGDRVAAWLPNTPAWIELLFACGRLGAILVAVNTRFRSSEVADIVGRSGAKLLVLWPEFRGIDFLGILEEIDPRPLDALTGVVLYSERDSRLPQRVLERPVLDYGELQSGAPLAVDRSDPEAGCAIFTTSGTTRAPKFVLHRQRAVVRHAHEVARFFGYREPDATLAQVLPLCGVFGFCQALATVAARRPMHLLSSFDPEALAELIERQGITHLNGPDDLYHRLFDVAAGTNALRSLRSCGFAAFTGQPEELVIRGESLGVPLVGLYGMSEVQAFFAARSTEEAPERRALAGGIPICTESAVRVCDPASGALLEPGQEGELQVRGPSLMAEYFGDPEATAATLTADGFVRTGDLGYVEEDGSFVFLARLGDALRLGGFLVAPAEIEAHLEEHPSVASAQVVGVATAAGVRPAAFVIPAASASIDESDLARHCRAGLARFKVPDWFFVVVEFPTTPGPNGTKIQRGKLREIAEEHVARSARPEPPRPSSSPDPP